MSNQPDMPTPDTPQLLLEHHLMASVRRMVVHLPQSFPFLATFRHMAIELGASPG